MRILTLTRIGERRVAACQMRRARCHLPLGGGTSAFGQEASLTPVTAAARATKVSTVSPLGVADAAPIASASRMVLLRHAVRCRQASALWSNVVARRMLQDQGGGLTTPGAIRAGNRSAGGNRGERWWGTWLHPPSRAQP